MPKEITNDDLAIIIKEGFDGVDKRFEGMDKRFDGVDKRFEGMDKRLTRVESLMVTKDYLDDKLSDLKGDLVILMRKEDTKLKVLVKILSERKIISKEEKDKIFGLEPFPEFKIA